MAINFLSIRMRAHRANAAYPLLALGLMIAFLGIDGRLGPVSLALRKAIALVALLLAAWPIFRGHARQRACAALAVLVGSAAVILATNTSFALAGYVVALAIAATHGDSAGTAMPPYKALTTAFLAYLCVRFSPDLSPQLAYVPRAIGRLVSTAVRK